MSIAALSGFRAGNVAGTAVSAVLKVRMILGREEGELSGRIGILIEWVRSMSWAFVKAWRGDGHGEEVEVVPLMVVGL
jgi:hypothetical protein